MMIRFNDDGTYTRIMSREEDIKMVSFNRGFYGGYEVGYEKEAIRIAKKMLKDGYSVQYVSEITKLPMEKVEKLIKK